MIWSPHLIEQQLIPFADMAHQLHNDLHSIDFAELRRAANQLRDTADGAEQADAWLQLVGIFVQIRNTLDRTFESEARNGSTQHV